MTVETATLVDAGRPARVAASFLLVAVVGGLVCHRRSGLLDRSVDAALERPLHTPVYGVVAGAVGWLAVTYAVGQVFRLGVGGLGTLAVAAGVGVALGVAGFGFAVVGTGLATAVNERRTWAGPLLGAGVSALPWVVLPPWPGAVVWAVVAAVGIGGPVRRWVHASRSIEK